MSELNVKRAKHFKEKMEYFWAEGKELKTLRDLHTGKIKPYVDELRAEAVKRAKHFKKKMEYFWAEGDDNNYFYYKGRFDEVMEMNNLRRRFEGEK